MLFYWHHSTTDFLWIYLAMNLSFFCKILFLLIRVFLTLLTILLITSRKCTWRLTYHLSQKHSIESLNAGHRRFFRTFNCNYSLRLNSLFKCPATTIFPTINYYCYLLLSSTPVTSSIYNFHVLLCYNYYAINRNYPLTFGTWTLEKENNTTQILW